MRLEDEGARITRRASCMPPLAWSSPPLFLLLFLRGLCVRRDPSYIFLRGLCVLRGEALALWQVLPDHPLDRPQLRVRSHRLRAPGRGHIGILLPLLRHGAHT